MLMKIKDYFYKTRLGEYYKRYRIKSELLKHGWEYYKELGLWIKAGDTMMMVENTLVIDNPDAFLVEDYYVYLEHPWKIYTLQKANRDVLKTLITKYYQIKYPQQIILDWATVKVMIDKPVTPKRPRKNPPTKFLPPK